MNPQFIHDAIKLNMYVTITCNLQVTKKRKAMLKREMITNEKACQLGIVGIKRYIIALICNCCWSFGSGNFGILWVYDFIN